MHLELEEPVVLAFTTSGTLQAFSSSNMQVLSVLPSRNGVPPLQPCRNWQCSSPSLNLIHREDSVVVVAQLRSGIGLAKSQSNETHSWTTSTTILNLNSFLPDNITPCILLDIVNIAGGYTAYCSQSHTLFSCDLYTNLNDLSESNFICTSLTDFESVPDARLASNFVAVDNYQVLFAYNGSLYRIRYKLNVASISFDLEGAVCRHMEYSRDTQSRSTLYLYCDYNRTLTIDLDRDLPVLNFWYLNDTGIPFPCDHIGDVFTVKQSPNHTQVTYGGQIFVTDGISFYDGKCIADSQNRPLFYFIDQTAGLFVVNSSSLTVHHVPDSCNVTRPCTGLYVFPGIYVMILRSGSPGLVVYDEDLVVLSQEELPVEVAGVGFYTIMRLVITTPTDAPTTAPTDAPATTPTDAPTAMSTDALTDTPTSMSTDTLTAMSTNKRVDTPTAMSTEETISAGKPTTLVQVVTVTRSNLSQSAVITIIGVVAAGVLVTVLIVFVVM